MPIAQKPRFWQFLSNSEPIEILRGENNFRRDSMGEVEIS
jgi:hypothetical protein